MADHAVTATLVAARMATASVVGVGNMDTVSITLPVGFVKTANPLPPDAGAPRYAVLVVCEGASAMDQSPCFAWTVGAPEIVATIRVSGGAVTLFIIVENVHSIVT